MGRKDSPQEGEWLQRLAETVIDAMTEGVDRDRFLEVAGETWDDTEAENADGGDVEASE